MLLCCSRRPALWKPCMIKYTMQQQSRCCALAPSSTAALWKGTWNAHIPARYDSRYTQHVAAAAAVATICCWPSSGRSASAASLCRHFRTPSRTARMLDAATAKERAADESEESSDNPTEARKGISPASIAHATGRGEGSWATSKQESVEHTLADELDAELEAERSDFIATYRTRAERAHVTQSYSRFPGLAPHGFAVDDCPGEVDVCLVRKYGGGEDVSGNGSGSVAGRGGTPKGNDGKHTDDSTITGEIVAVKFCVEFEPLPEDDFPEDFPGMEDPEMAASLPQVAAGCVGDDSGRGGYFGELMADIANAKANNEHQKNEEEYAAFLEATKDLMPNFKQNAPELIGRSGPTGRLQVVVCKRLRRLDIGGRGRRKKNYVDDSWAGRKRSMFFDPSSELVDRLRKHKASATGEDENDAVSVSNVAAEQEDATATTSQSPQQHRGVNEHATPPHGGAPSHATLQLAGPHFGSVVGPNPVGLTAMEEVDADGGALLFHCRVSMGQFRIMRITHFEDAGVALSRRVRFSEGHEVVYRGHVLKDSIDSLRELWYPYLRKRGIDEQLFAFIDEYKLWKERRDYAQYLERVRSFVLPVPASPLLEESEEDGTATTPSTSAAVRDDG